jgi:hypothetical protein
MEDGLGTIGDQLFRGSGYREIAGEELDQKSGFLRLGRRHHIVQRQAADVSLAETAIAH